MEHQKPLSKKLFIEELELPARAESLGVITTHAIGEESFKGACEPPPGTFTTLALGEECFKA
ncbi:MAG: hypothetical protein WD873_06255 [Candidatus Hydrogenedentales bacterium]